MSAPTGSPIDIRWSEEALRALPPTIDVPTMGQILTRTVQRAVEQLEDLGYLCCMRRAAGVRGRANSYALSATIDTYASKFGPYDPADLMLPERRARQPKRSTDMSRVSRQGPVTSVMYLGGPPVTSDANYLSPVTELPVTSDVLPNQRTNHQDHSDVDTSGSLRERGLNGQRA